MIEPHQLIGLPFRLGADPERHHAADCLSLSKAVLQWYGIATPTPQRQWYRRLRRGDYSVFPEQLAVWGEQVTAATLGAVGLSSGQNDRYGLVVFYEGGWLHFNTASQVSWVPLTALTPVGIYCQQKPSSATPSA